MTKEEEMKIEMLFMRIGNEIYKFSPEIRRVKNEYMRKRADQNRQSECVRALEDKTQTQQNAKLLNKASVESLGPIKGSMSSYLNKVGGGRHGL